MKNYRSKKGLFVKTLTNLIISFSGMAIIQECTFSIYEEELPAILKK